MAWKRSRVRFSYGPPSRQPPHGRLLRPIDRSAFSSHARPQSIPEEEPMNANACQIPQVAEADLASLCTSCTRRGNCLREFAARTIGERMDDGTYQVQLLDECEDYRNDGSGKTQHGSL